MHRRRVGKIVRRYIHRLYRGDGALVGIGDTLFQFRQLGAHGRLITEARRHLPHQAGHFRAGLDKPEDIVDEQQHVTALVVAEILGHRQRGVADAETRPRRLVHLAEDHHHIRQYAGLLHLAVKFLAFATTFADAAKNTHAFVLPDHVVNHLGEQHRLAHPCPAKQARLAAALQRHQHIDNLDARREHFRPGRTARQRRRRPMHRTPLHICRRRFTVDGIAEHIEHAREDALADRCLQRPAGVFHRHTTRQALGGGQRNATHAMRIQLRQHFDDDLIFLARPQQRVDRRQLRIEAHIHDAAAHRDDHAGIRCAGVVCHFPVRFHNTISSLPHGNPLGQAVHCNIA